MRKFVSLSILAIAICLSSMAQAQITTNAKQAIVIDFETKQILLQKNAHDHMPTSSMSKLMTAYAVFDALKKKEFSLDDTFLVSKKAWKKGGSKMFVEVDKRVKIDDLLQGVLVQSGNDATIVLAEGISGGEDYFAEHLNAIAKSIGMNESHFANASGWPDPDHYSTAYDLSILASKMWENFPEHTHYFSQHEFTYSGITQKNRNPLLYRDIGADGMKTGHTEVGGYGLIGTGSYNDRRVIIVINGLDSSKERAQEGARLLEWGLRRFKYQDIFTNDQILKEIPVKFAKEKQISAGVNESIKLAIPLSAGDTFETDIQVNPNLIAPIKAGDVVGSVTVSIKEQDPITYSLVALTNATEKGFIGKTIEKIFDKKK